jgi:hypothetical protein
VDIEGAAIEQPCGFSLIQFLFGRSEIDQEERVSRFAVDAELKIGLGVREALLPDQQDSEVVLRRADGVRQEQVPERPESL